MPQWGLFPWNWIMFILLRTRRPDWVTKSNVLNRRNFRKKMLQFIRRNIKHKLHSQTWVRLLDGVTDISIVDRKTTLGATTFFDLYLCQTWSHARLPKQTNTKTYNNWRVINGSLTIGNLIKVQIWLSRVNPVNFKAMVWNYVDK